MLLHIRNRCLDNHIRPVSRTEHTCCYKSPLQKWKKKVISVFSGELMRSKHDSILRLTESLIDGWILRPCTHETAFLKESTEGSYLILPCWIFRIVYIYEDTHCGELGYWDLVTDVTADTGVTRFKTAKTLNVVDLQVLVHHSHGFVSVYRFGLFLCANLQFNLF